MSKPVHHGYFVLRSPSLPIDALSEHSEPSPNGLIELSYEEKLASARRRLHRLIQDSHFREALFLSSRSLWKRLTSYDPHEAAKSEKLLTIELSLTRYLLRMAMDCTPFGLSAGHSVGRIARLRSRLQLVSASEGRISSRLSASLSLQLLQGSGLWQTASPLSRNGNQLRFYDRKWSATGLVTRLNGVRWTRTIETVASYAKEARTFAALARRIARDRVPIGDARAFVQGLIEMGLLVPASENRKSEKHWNGPGRSSSKLQDAERMAGDLQIDIPRHLRHLDNCNSAERFSVYSTILSRLGAFPDVSVPPRPFDVCLSRSGGDLRLDEEAVESAVAAVMALGPGSKPNASALNQFASRFGRRYGGAFVPILDVFDTGIGIPWIGESSVPNQLLKQPAIPAAWDGVLQELASSAKWGDLKQIDLPVHETHGRPPHTARNQVGYILFTLLSDEWREEEEDDSRGVLYGAGGACGAELLSRASMHDPALRKLAMLCARREENVRDGEIFAEVSHVPDGWSADVVERPALRRYRVDCLGSGGSDATGETAIGLEDIHVGLRNGRFMLRSGRLRKWFVPRFTSSYDPSSADLPVFQFLFAVCAQDCEEIKFEWPTSFSRLSYLPRVRIAQWIVSRRRWILHADQRASILNAGDGQRYAALQNFRRKFRWPRFIEIVKASGSQYVDLDDPISVGALCNAHRGGDPVAIHEVLDEPRFAAARGPEGSFRHEIVLPYRVEHATKSRRRPGLLRLPRGCTPKSIPASRPPGIETRQVQDATPGWIYAKIFAGQSVLDLLLIRYVDPLVQRLRRAGVIAKWFFVRYADPDSHLRLRLHLRDEGNRRLVVGAVRKIVQQAIMERCAWSADWASYEPESRDYGGPFIMALSEEMFSADSDAVVQLLACAGSPPVAGRRWLLAAKGMHDMMRAFGLDEKQTYALLEVIVARTPESGRPDKREVSAIYRSCRKEMTALLTDRWTPDLEAVFRQRHKSLSTIFEQMRRVVTVQGIGMPREQLLANHVHMFANRLFAESDGKEEFLSYELLRRATRSRNNIADH